MQLLHGLSHHLIVFTKNRIDTALLRDGKEQQRGRPDAFCAEEMSVIQTDKSP